MVVQITGAFDGTISEENFQGWTSARITLTGDRYADADHRQHGHAGRRDVGVRIEDLSDVSTFVQGALF